MQLTSRQIFGRNALQSATEIIICKADLPLTSSSNNSAKQLLAAILLNALSNFQGFIKDELGRAILDENGEVISYDNSNLYESLFLFQWETQLIKIEQIPYIKHTIVFQQIEKYEV